MSIGVQCQGCGRRYRVSDDRAGKPMVCECCGHRFTVEGPRYVDKLCVMCGIDVSSLTRTRDPQGNYYCQPCWDEAIRQHRITLTGQREPEFAWITRQLSRLHLKRILRPLIILTALLMAGLTWLEPQLGITTGATLLVAGGSLMLVCTIWLFVVPFRDGPQVGVACILSAAARRAWAARNPDFNLRRPASLAMSGVFMILASVGYFCLSFAARQS